MNNQHEIQVVEFGIGEEVFAVPVGLVREIWTTSRPSRCPMDPTIFWA